MDLCKKNKIPLNQKVLFENFVETYDYIWFWCARYDALFRCRKNEILAERIAIPLNKNNGEFSCTSYSKIFLYQNKIVCTPRMANEILVYDIQKQESRYIDIGVDAWSESALKYGKFYEAVVKEKYVYFIGCWSPFLLKFNMEEECVEEIINLYEKFPESQNKNNHYFLSCAFLGDILLIPACEHNMVFEVNVSQMKYCINKIEKVKKGFSSICINNDDVWLAPRWSQPIVCWDYKTKDVKCFNEYPENFNISSNLGLGYITKVKNTILLFPALANRTLLLHLKNGKMDFEKNLNDYYDTSLDGKEYIGQKYIFIENKNNIIYIFSRFNRELITYSLEKGIINKKSYVVSEVLYNNYMKNILENEIANHKYIIEGENTFEFFLKRELGYLSSNKNYKMIGLDIFEKLKK